MFSLDTRINHSREGAEQLYTQQALSTEPEYSSHVKCSTGSIYLIVCIIHITNLNANGNPYFTLDNPTVLQGIWVTGIYIGARDESAGRL